MAALKGKKCVLRAFVKRDVVVYVQILFVTGVRCSRKMKVLLAGSWEDQ